MLEEIRTELTTSNDGGLAKWLRDQYDLCEQAEADATTITLQVRMRVRVRVRMHACILCTLRGSFSLLLSVGRLAVVAVGCFGSATMSVGSRWLFVSLPLTRAAVLQRTCASHQLTQAIRGGEPTADPTILLRHGQFYTFGKSSACDVTLRHGSISRMHAVLMMLDDGLLHCLDMRSSYGTHVNDRKLKVGLVLACM